MATPEKRLLPSGTASAWCGKKLCLLDTQLANRGTCSAGENRIRNFGSWHKGIPFQQTERVACYKLRTLSVNALNKVVKAACRNAASGIFCQNCCESGPHVRSHSSKYPAEMRWTSRWELQSSPGVCDIRDSLHLAGREIINYSFKSVKKPFVQPFTTLTPRKC